MTKAAKHAAQSVRSDTLTTARLRQAEQEISARDPRMAEVIAKVGACTMEPRADGTHFEHLARAIVYQQLSGSAAATIYGRFRTAVGATDGPPDPLRLLAADDAVLRGCGLSAAKMNAVRDLAKHVHEGSLPLDRLDALDDQEIIDALVAVRGIGPWTAQMFLMFRLGRPDVLPVLDLGVRKGAQKIYRTRKLPDAARLGKIARNWRPWSSVASWYCWRVLDLEDAGGW